MKKPWKFVILLTAVAVVACTKEWSGRKQASVAGQNGGPGKTVFASNWTTLSQWNKDPKGFYAEQVLPRKKKDEKVLLFARKLWAQDQAEDTADLPLQLPLNFLPYTDQPGLTETWDYELQEDKLRVNLAVTGTEEPSPREVAVRYVLVPNNIWEQLKASEPGVEDLAYEDLVARLEINP